VKVHGKACGGGGGQRKRGRRLSPHDGQQLVDIDPLLHENRLCDRNGGQRTTAVQRRRNATKGKESSRPCGALCLRRFLETTILRGETRSGPCVQGVGQLTIADWTFEKALMAWRYIASGIRSAKTRPTKKI
jgi:hypothetical protein